MLSNNAKNLNPFYSEIMEDIFTKPFSNDFFKDPLMNDANYHVQEVQASFLKIQLLRRASVVLKSLKNDLTESLENFRFTRLPVLFPTDQADSTGWWWFSEYAKTSMRFLTYEYAASPFDEEKSLRVFVKIGAEPTWETWRRWKNIYLDEFELVKKWLHHNYGPMHFQDLSVTELMYTFSVVNFRFRTKKPILTFPVEIFTPWDFNDFQSRNVQVYCDLNLTVPNNPKTLESGMLQTGCKMEVVTTSSKVKKVVCV